MSIRGNNKPTEKECVFSTGNTEQHETINTVATTGNDNMEQQVVVDNEIDRYNHG